MKRLLRLERIFITQNLKVLMEYKGDFITGVVGFFLQQALNILFLGVIFSQIPNLQGWTLQQILFIYGFSLLPKGVDHLFFDNLWLVGQRLVRMGEFDKYLTRPLNPLFHVMVERFQPDAVGELLMGIALLLSSGDVVHWTALKALLFIVAIPFAAAIYTALKIATSSVAFWTKQSGALTYIFYMLNDFAKYPTSIYNYAVRFIISFIVPFAFTAFYPASFFLNGQNMLFNIGGLVLIAALMLTLALWFWRRGLAAYESAGS